MFITSINRLFSRVTKQASLQNILIFSFVLQIFAVVALTGYFSFSNARKSVNKLGLQLSQEVTNRIEQHVLNYLEKSNIVHQAIAASIDGGTVNLEDLEGIHRYFFHEVHRLDEVSFLYFGNPKGEFVGIEQKDNGQTFLYIRDQFTAPLRNIYLLNKQGNRNNLIRSVSYDPRVRDWYKAALQAKKNTWSSVYPFASSGYTTLGISLATPIYNPQTGKLQAVLGNDISLSQISNFLRRLKISPNGKAAIIERSGQIIATSSPESPFIRENLVQRRLQITNSSDPFIKATGKYLQAKFGQFKQIENLSSRFNLDNGEQQFLQVKTLQDPRGLDWLIIVTIPETDFTQRIQANTRITIGLCLVALIVATGSSILTARWITRPLLLLNQAAKDIAKGQWNKTIQIDRSDEVGELAQSFNQMASQLQQSFHNLELRVQERTVELQEAKEVAETANQAKDQFLVNISQELRTPINSILGYANILQRDSDLNSKQIQSVRVIEQSGSHLLTLIDDLLDFSKIKANQIQLYPTNLHFPTFLKGVVGMVEIMAQEKELLFTYETEGVLPTGIKADEKRLRQVLLNLLSNAVKFTDQGLVTFKVSVLGELNLSYYPSKQKNIRFEVMDTGIGMSTTQIGKIFQPFEKANGVESPTPGTGLGLAVTKRIVELMGSELKVQSQLSTSSTFWFDVIFDVVEFASEPYPKKSDLEKEKSTGQIVGYKGKQLQILIVDNLEDNRLLLVYMLEPLGFKIIEAENGQEGLDVAIKSHPDLILTDLLMPIKTGLNMVQELREIPEFKHTPILALSASTFDVMEKESMAVGCNAFVPKPIEEKKLRKLLEDYLDLEWIYETAAT
ncbi:MAG: ATP-binding protein [Prochloraceae cyanobacterium]